MASAERAAKGWRAKWYIRVGPKRHQRSYTPPAGFPTYDAAYKYALDQESDARRGKYIDPAKGKTLFLTVAEQWKAGKGGRPNSRGRRQSRFKSQLVPKWGHWQVAEIDYAAVKAWIVDLEAKGYTEIYVGLCLRDFRSIMAEAVRLGLVSENPAGGVQALGRSSHPKVALTMEEMLVFTGMLAREDDRDLVTALFATGCRWSELAGIKRRSVNLRDATVAVAPGDALTSEAGKLFESEGKSQAADRVIQLPAWGVAAFRRVMERRPGRFDDRVFRAQRGGLLRANNYYEHVWNPVKEQLACLDGKRRKASGSEVPADVLALLEGNPDLLDSLKEKLPHLTFHCARHSNATWRVEQGTDMPTLMDQMGWDSVASAKPYFHVNEESRRKSATGLQSLYRSTTHKRARKHPSKRSSPRRRPHSGQHTPVG